MANNSDSTGCFWVAVVGLAAWWYFGGGDCERYASEFSCSYVENDAEYEVWYWRNLESDDGADEMLIGKAKGIATCEGNARAFAAAIGETWNYRAYICVLMKDGRRMEKHRNLG